ncbi:MAG: hypothetical protein FWC47_07265, partial [Oscillospiraceae bacterium]|nr:hypothetical protein [Oscillospiraceae bacterium]
MKQTKKNRIRSKITEKTALCLLLAVILSTNIGPITFATSGTASSNGTTIETAVRTVDTDRATGTDYYIVSSKLPTWNDPNFTLGHGPSLKPNAISGQDTTQRVSVRLNIFWKEPSSSGATITFTIPHGADYFQLGTDSSTAQYVKSATIATRVVAGEGKPRLVTLTLQGNPPIGQTFVIFYSFGYYPYAFNFHGDTGDLTPHLNIGGTEIVSGTPLTVSTAAEAIMYPGLEYTSTLYKISQTDAGFDANINYNTQPRSTQLAKIGVNYSMNPIVQAKLPDSYAIVSGYSAANRLDTTRRNPNSTAYINGATMKTASITITLPIEAVLAPISEQSPYFSRFAISTDALGRTVLTSSSWGNGTGSLNTAGATVSNGDAGTGSNSIVMTSYYTTAYRPEGPTFKVSYNAAPANGTTYDYDVKLTGTWYSGAPFEFDKLVPHLYSPNPITANVELRARLTATTLPGIPQGNLWTHRTNVNDGYLI